MWYQGILNRGNNMETFKAFLNGQAAKSSGAAMRTFDWDKAARIIKDRKPAKASAGLESDYEWTCGTIYENGELVTDSYTYLSSNWATPMLILDDNKEIECFCTEETSGWSSDTKWPVTALIILGMAK